MATVVKVRRQGGEVVQWCDVYIGRAWSMGGWNLAKSKYHNPYSSNKYGLFECVILYIDHLYDSGLINDVEELRGKVLGCWCKPARCHGDILVRVLEMTKVINGGPFNLIIIPTKEQLKDAIIQEMQLE